MKINIQELPLTLDAIRQEVITKEGKKRAVTYQQSYIDASKILLFVPFAVLLIVYEFLSPASATKMVLWMGIFMVIGIIASSYVMSGKAEKVFHKRYATTNYGLSEKDIVEMMLIYMRNTIDSIEAELLQSEKDILVLQQHHTKMRNDYYEPSRVYLHLTHTLSQEKHQ